MWKRIPVMTIKHTSGNSTNSTHSIPNQHFNMKIIAYCSIFLSTVSTTIYFLMTVLHDPLHYNSPKLLPGSHISCLFQTALRWEPQKENWLFLLSPSCSLANPINWVGSMEYTSSKAPSLNPRIQVKVNWEILWYTDNIETSSNEFEVPPYSLWPLLPSSIQCMHTNSFFLFHVKNRFSSHHSQY